jgi:hypothetical protein
VEANKVLLEERLKIDSEAATAAANILAKYDIGRIEDLKFESETENSFYITIRDESNFAYHLTFNKWGGGLSAIIENDCNGRIVFGAIADIPQKIIEDYKRHQVD